MSQSAKGKDGIRLPYFGSTLHYDTDKNKVLVGGVMPAEMILYHCETITGVGQILTTNHAIALKRHKYKTARDVELYCLTTLSSMTVSSIAEMYGLKVKELLNQMYEMKLSLELNTRRGYRLREKIIEVLEFSKTTAPLEALKTIDKMIFLFSKAQVMGYPPKKKGEAISREWQKMLDKLTLKKSTASKLAQERYRARVKIKENNKNT